MRVIKQTPLDEIRHKEQQSQAKDAQLQSVGISLAQEKAKGIQKDGQIRQVGQEVALLKAEIIKLKGAVDK